MFIFTIILLLVTTHQLKQDSNHLLVLQQSDFPLIFKTYSHLVIEFYAPWSGHCKKFASVYKQISAELKEKRSYSNNISKVVRLAKVDATTQTRIAQRYDFFIEGNPIPYNGQRTKQDIISWIERKLYPAVVEISTEKELNKLSLKKTVSVVYFGEDPEQIEYFKALALADDTITYYTATGKLLLNRSYFQMHRNFDQAVTYTGSIHGLAEWIGKYSKPYIQPFEMHIIRMIFAEDKPALVLFNVDKDAFVHNTLSKFAKTYHGSLIITEIQPTHEHFKKFTDYLSIDKYYPKLLIILAGSKNKIVYPGKVGLLSEESIVNFIEMYERNQLRKYGITDPITSDPEL